MRDLSGGPPLAGARMSTDAPAGWAGPVPPVPVQPGPHAANAMALNGDGLLAASCIPPAGSW